MFTYLREQAWRNRNAAFAWLRTRCKAEEACKLERVVEDLAMEPQLPWLSSSVCLFRAV